MNRMPSSSVRATVLIILSCAVAQGGERGPIPIHALRDSYLTDGAVTRRAFTSVVKEANEWTVRVLADNDEVAYGVIVRDDGYILTKGSRLPSDSRLSCELPDRRTAPAIYVGYHPEHDLALLKVSASNLPVVRWREGGDPEVGRWAITPDALGAPRAVGVISVSRRAVPEVKVRGVLGVRLSEESRWAKVDHVLPKSAAEKSGLQTGDVITQVNEKSIASPESFVREIRRHRPHETLTLLINRGGQEYSVNATLTQPFGDFLTRIAAQNEMGGKLSERRTGFPVVLQHDSVLKPEECGGPLVDLTGAAIGINIARAGRTESYAIPNDVVRPVIDELLAGKYPAPRVKLAGAPAESSEVNTSASGGE